MYRFLWSFLLSFAVLPAAAQRVTDRLQVGLHLQTASYHGERSEYKGAGGLGSGFGLEAAYSFLRPGTFEAVLRFDRAIYPGLVSNRPGFPSVNGRESSESRARFMAYARRLLSSRRPIQPYAFLGLAGASGRINGDSQSAWGPLLGVGAQISVAAARLAIFSEFLAHATIPNDGVDLAGGDGSSPDRLGTFSVGIRYRAGVPSERTRLVVRAPRRSRTGEPAAFEAQVISTRADAYAVRWVFGDGVETVGPRPTHTFSEAGSYTILVSASDGSETVTRRVKVSVSAPPVPAAVETRPLPSPAPAREPVRSDPVPTPPSPPVTEPPVSEAPPAAVPQSPPPAPGGTALDVLEIAQAPLRPRAGEEILFSPVVRGSQYTCSWDFGDGSSADVCEARHTYAQPGRFSYRLRVSADGSTASFTKEVNVESNRCSAVDRLHSVNFFVNSSELIPEMRSLLRENVDLLIGCPGQEITIVASATGNEQDARRLANQRALAVFQYYRLMGIQSDRFAEEFDIRVEQAGTVESWQQRYVRTTLR